MTFRVTDNTTGAEPNCESIVLYEEWAKSLLYCDVEGFFISGDGQLILGDETGHYVFCPKDRFTITITS